MARDHDVTLGELFRLVEAVRDDHGEKLTAINGQIREVSSNLAKHDARLDFHDQRIVNVTRCIEDCSVTRGDVITKRDLKFAVAILVAAWAVFTQAAPQLVKMISVVAQ